MPRSRRFVEALFPPDEQPLKAVHPKASMCRHPAAQPVAWNLVLCLYIFAVALDGGSVALHPERRAHCLDGTPKRNPLAVGQHPPLGPELVGFGRLRAHLYPRGEGPRTSHRPFRGFRSTLLDFQ